MPDLNCLVIIPKYLYIHKIASMNITHGNVINNPFSNFLMTSKITSQDLDGLSSNYGNTSCRLKTQDQWHYLLLFVIYMVNYGNNMLNHFTCSLWA